MVGEADHTYFLANTSWLAPLLQRKFHKRVKKKVGRKCQNLNFHTLTVDDMGPSRISEPGSTIQNMGSVVHYF